jgi:hypothetical protein
MKKDKNPHAVALGSLGGSKKSKRKTAAARENGKKGGRPKLADPAQHLKD